MPSIAASGGRRALVRALPLLTIAAGVVAAGCTVAQEPFPNLTDAEIHLSAALDALQRAPDTFGGHKHQAIEMIHGALNQIELARVSYRP